MVRAGKGAFLIDIFKNKQLVAMGWDLGDLSDKSSEEITQLVNIRYARSSNNRKSVIASQERKFRYDIKVNDHVLTYDLKNRLFLLGIINSDYYFSKEKVHEDYSDIRDVKWIGEIPRDNLKDSTNKTLGTAITLFNINDDAKEDILSNVEKLDFHKKESPVNIWKITAGKNEVSDEVWDIFKKESYVGIDYSYGNSNIDYSKFKSQNDIKSFLGDKITSKSVAPSTIWKFINVVKKGDVVVVNKGLSKLAGIGIVTGDFIPQTENNHKNEFDLNNIRSVDWILTPDILEIEDHFFAPTTFVEVSNYPYYWNNLVYAISRTDDVLKNKILNFLFNAFYDDYFNVEIGKTHFNKYKLEKDEVNKVWNEILDKYSSNEYIANDIWEKLLNRPIKVHTDGVNNIKSAIQGKINYSDEEMDRVAIAFFEVIKDLLNADDTIAQKEILNEYAKNEYSKGFKSSRLSSILYYLDNSFYVINNKSVYTLKALSWMFGDEISFDSDLKHYIDNNEKFKKLLNKINNSSSFNKININDFEIFDMFCHWMCDKKLGNYAGKSQYSSKNAKMLPITLISNDIVIEKRKYQKLNLNPDLLEVKLREFKILSNKVMQICASLNAGKHIILDGTPGTGKTDLALKFSSAAEENKFMDGYILTTATSDWSTFDTIGGLMPGEDGKLSFHEGKFLEAISLNKWLIIDEINRADIDKAFGQLFTVLSGQNVELPYKENGKSIKIKNWDEIYSKHDFKTATYYIGKNWRIIGTMNVDDKDSLFDLSYAFMRRFMFIDVDLPNDEDYKKIIETWANNLDDEYINQLLKIHQIIQYKKIGPAIFKDMIDYIKQRSKLNNDSIEVVLTESVESYIIPQLEGLNKSKIEKIRLFFENLGIDVNKKLNELLPKF